MKKKSVNSYIVLSLVFLIGLSLLLYPTVADHWNALHQSRAISNYSEEVQNLDSARFDEMFEEACKYNEQSLSRANPYLLSEEERAQYPELLSVSDSGVMGYIDIPTIKVTLPIYHTTEDDVLQVAIGHVDWSSLPTGGESTHSVFSGHRGLPSARLFTDLDKLVEGDIFYLNVLDRTLAYEVDQILIVEPDQTDSLLVREGKDYCTLVTCTPYGVNTHRLLVRGHRIEIKDESVLRVVSDAAQIQPMLVAVFVAIPLLILLFLGFIVDDSIKQKYLR